MSSIEPEGGYAVAPRTLWQRSVEACRETVVRPNVQDAAAAVFDQAVVGAKAFLTGVIVGRACTMEEFGLYGLAVSFVSWTLSIQSSLVGTPYMVYWPRLGRQERLQYGGSTVLHSLLMALGAVCVLAAGSAALQALGYQENSRLIAFALLGAITFIMLQDCTRQMAFAHMQMRKAAAMDTLVTMTQLAVIFAMAQSGRLTVPRVCLVMGITSCLGVLGWCVSRRDTYIFQVRCSATDFVRNWDFGKWVLAGALFWILAMDCYPWLLAASLGASAAGIWVACAGVCALGNPLLLGIANFLGPRMAHVYSQDGVVGLRRFVLRAVLIYLAGAVPVALGLIAVGWWLVPTIYGRQYAGHGIIMATLGVSLMMDAVRFCCSRGLFAVERADIVLAGSCGPFLAVLPGTIVLIRFWGPEGAAVAMLATNAMTALCIGVLFLRHTSKLRRSLGQ